MLRIRPTADRYLVRSSQRFDKEAATSTRFSAGSSPSKTSGTFTTTFAGPTPAAVSAVSTPSTAHAEHDLTAGLRNISLDDEYTTSGTYRAGGPAGVTPSGVPAVAASAAPPARGPAPPTHGAGPRPGPGFNGGFVQPADFYYGGNAPVDAFNAFNTYDSYRSTPDPSLYGSPPPTSLYPTPQTMVAHDLQRSPSAMYFDYSSQGRPPPSPYYYPSPQAMMYHRGPHSPIPPPITLGQPPAVADKARGDMPVSTLCMLHRQNLNSQQFQMQQRMPPHQQHQHQHQHQHQQNIMMPPASPLPHMFPGGVDYSQQMQMVMQPQPYQGGPAHGGPIHHHGPGMHAFQHQRGGRREDGAGAMRSQLLDEFRSNKTRKWDLRVSQQSP